MATDLFSELEWRGMVVECTEGVRDLLAREAVTAYIGFDPTASSLHVGSLLPVMALARLQRFGHHAIAIAGGGTGMIGDPSGKTQERQLLSLELLDENLRGIRAQLAHFLDFEVASNPARIINNADWLAPLNLIEFLRDIGKHFTVNYMLAKESVKRRLEQEDGISYTEFTYLMLQAYDFLTLYDRVGCRLQMGGSDQWGNITAGIELIRRMRGGQAHGLVLPLVTTASGVKFGKTESGTIWLDPHRTSPYDFYQFWVNTDDRDVVAYLKYFTFLDRERIDQLEADVLAEPEQRTAQRVLASEVTRIVHSEQSLAEARERTERLFAQRGQAASAGDIVVQLEPSADIEVEGDSIPLSRVLTHAGVALASSASEAARLIKGGGVYLNGERVSDERKRISAADTLTDGRLLVQKGQRQKHVVRVRFK